MPDIGLEPVAGDPFAGQIPAEFPNQFPEQQAALAADPQHMAAVAAANQAWRDRASQTSFGHLYNTLTTAVDKLRSGEWDVSSPEAAERTGALGGALEMAGLGMGGGAAAPGEAILGSGPIRRLARRPAYTTELPDIPPGADWRISGAPPPIGHNLPPPEPPAGLDDRIATRVPWAKSTSIDPHASPDLQSNYGASLASPAAFEKNADIIRSQYTGHAIPDDLDAKATSEAFIEHAKNNLLALHDSVDEATRASTGRWYDGARWLSDQWAQEFGLEPRQVAGVIAAQSPQKDWFQNVSVARRVLDTMRDQQGTAITPEMENWARDYVKDKPPTDLGRQGTEDFLARNQGVPLGQMTNPLDIAHFIRFYDGAHRGGAGRFYPEYSPEGQQLGLVLNEDGTPSRVGWGSMRDIAKAISVVQDGSVPNISEAMGGAHKVRNFYNNIISPDAPHGDTTIDTHAIAAANLFPLTGEDAMTAQGLGQSGSADSKTGSRGLYGLYTEAYRRAAEERGILPRQMQSITWEAVRKLFPAEWKAESWYRDGIRSAWDAYHDGLASLQDTHQAVWAAANARPAGRPAGTAAPPPLGPGAAAAPAPGGAAHPAELSAGGLPREPAAAAGGGGGAVAPRAVPGSIGLEPANGDPFAGIP